MPNGMAVTRMTPRKSKPENTTPKAGSGTEKPKLVNALLSPSMLRPPKSRPNRLEPQANTNPTMMATRPAGMPLGYFTPPNQLTMMMAKQVRSITGVMNMSSAGFIEMKV